MRGRSSKTSASSQGPKSTQTSEWCGNVAGRALGVRRARARPHTDSCGWGLLGLLPILQRLWPSLNAFQIVIDTVRAGRVVGLLRGGFLPASLLFCATFLALALALALLL